MSEANVTLTIRLADAERTRLMLWELTALVDRMRVMANPEADALERVLDRFAKGGDDETEASMRDPDPDVRNDPIPEPVRTTPLPGEPPEPHSDPKPDPEPGPAADDDPSPGYLTPEPDPTGPDTHEGAQE